MHGTRFGAHARRGWQAHVGFQTPEPRTQNDVPHFRAPMHDRLFEDDRKRRIRPSRSDPPTPMIARTSHVHAGRETRIRGHSAHARTMHNSTSVLMITKRQIGQRRVRRDDDDDGCRKRQTTGR